MNLRNANWQPWAGRLEEGERRQGEGLGSYGHNAKVSSLEVWEHSKGRGAFLVPDPGWVAGGRSRAGGGGTREEGVVSGLQEQGQKKSGPR